MSGTNSRIVEDFGWLDPASAQGLGPWVWVAAAVVVLAVLVAGFLILRRRKGGIAFLAPPAPHEVALKALRELASLMKEDQDLEFTKQVSLILRVYIQDRFGIRAPHRSTEEFLIEARQSENLSEDHQRLLARFLAQCDLVKFARRRVVVAEMQTLSLSAKAFVEGTISREEPKPEVAK
jgi:hypothetical protein